MPIWILIKRRQNFVANLENLKNENKMYYIYTKFLLLSLQFSRTYPPEFGSAWRMMLNADPDLGGKKAEIKLLPESDAEGLQWKSKTKIFF